MDVKQSAMSTLTPVDLKKVEKQYEAGIGSAAVVELFKQKGERFSEATLRKYVQLGLLPKSRRVGERGRNRGSRGVYPPEIVRLINDIKASLDAGATLDEIRLSKVGLAGEVDGLMRVTGDVVQRFEEAIAREADRGRRSLWRRTLDKHRQVLTQEAKSLSRLAGELGVRTQS